MNYFELGITTIAQVMQHAGFDPEKLHAAIGQEYVQYNETNFMYRAGDGAWMIISGRGPRVNHAVRLWGEGYGRRQVSLPDHDILIGGIEEHYVYEDMARAGAAVMRGKQAENRVLH